ncbi:hypothetical protein SCE1572_13375 [Sorangium cellulosum So0157-2]|uniref:FAD-binding domain-containing protein n=2 Tax=Sorangium cellulosum TaxID=56 RepID=S4XQF9_SORCE|nr:hypothetical protein SCE1572_13375 [Sorangium cellulosum So0157-2]
MEQANRFTDSARLVDTYRRDRVLLAGDAAHIHSPLGGQGLSLGLVDAANLGWKLAAVIRGDKPDSLLDSYTSERRPVAEAVLANTLAQVALTRPDPQSSAMRQLFAKLMEIDAVNDHLDGLTTGLATRYDLGAERDLVGRLTGDRPVGRAAARTSLFAEMAEGEGILLDASPDGHAAALAAGFTRVRCLPADAGPSMLIRPDGCIAWAGDVGDVEGLVDALERWFASAAPRARRLPGTVMLGRAVVLRAVAIGAANVADDVTTGGQNVTGRLPGSVVAAVASLPHPSQTRRRNAQLNAARWSETVEASPASSSRPICSTRPGRSWSRSASRT